MQPKNVPLFECQEPGVFGNRRDTTEVVYGIVYNTEENFTALAFKKHDDNVVSRDFVLPFSEAVNTHTPRGMMCKFINCKL